SVNRYAKFAGDDRPERPPGDRPVGRHREGPRRDGPRPARPGGVDRNRPPRGDRPPRPGADKGNFRRDDRRDGPRREERREPVAPLPEITVSFLPDDKGVESLARQIKMTGRSFPLFDIAQMILKKPERHHLRFETKPKPEGGVLQPLFLCAIDGTLWLSEAEAVGHVLGRHFGLFYQAEKTPVEPPKGAYTFVAQCGMSGVILGPPNYHDYQNQLRKLHSERFSRMPFDAFKSRVKIVKEEAVVKKWIEEQSFKTEYVCLNVTEPLRLAGRAEVEKHFREVHLPNIITETPRHALSGLAARDLRSPGLQRLIRFAWEDQKRFPLQIATVLSQQFASHGLQFFKVNKTITHVAVARPHYLDLAVTPVSELIKRIVQFIDATPKCTRRQLIETLAPTPPAAPSEPAPAAAEPAATAVAPEPPPPTPEQAAVIGDLHWLIHQGHVIEFANGVLETAKKPLPKPVRAPKPKDAAAPAPESEVKAESDPVAEATAENLASPGVEPALSPPLENIVPVGIPPSTAATISDPAPQGLS
ncbi:MAG TPA: hypothetical protein VH598_07285, partial [Verrucomicrobiae bacterium]|nr:hypothetical protein [Verrucomicrobiae bacterium]